MYDVLDLEIDEPEAHGDSAASGITNAAREDVISPRADAVTSGQGDYGTAVMDMESAPETPPLAFTSSSECPIPQPGSPPPATMEQTFKSQDEFAPDPTRPPLATSLANLACLLSWGAGGERGPHGQDQDTEETEGTASSLRSC